MPRPRGFQATGCDTSMTDKAKATNHSPLWFSPAFWQVWYGKFIGIILLLAAVSVYQCLRLLQPQPIETLPKETAAQPIPIDPGWKELGRIVFSSPVNPHAFIAVSSPPLRLRLDEERVYLRDVKTFDLSSRYPALLIRTEEPMVPETTYKIDIHSRPLIVLPLYQTPLYTFRVRTTRGGGHIDDLTVDQEHRLQKSQSDDKNGPPL